MGPNSRRPCCAIPAILNSPCNLDKASDFSWREIEAPWERSGATEASGRVPPGCKRLSASRRSKASLTRYSSIASKMREFDHILVRCIHGIGRKMIPQRREQHARPIRVQVFTVPNRHAYIPRGRFHLRNQSRRTLTRFEVCHSANQTTRWLGKTQPSHQTTEQQLRATL